MLSSKHKPNSLNFKDYNGQSATQFTPSTPTVINLLQDLTPTNYGYHFDISENDDVLRQFTIHYKSFEDSDRAKVVNESHLNYLYLNNGGNFTHDLLTSDDSPNGLMQLEATEIGLRPYDQRVNRSSSPPPASICYSDGVSCHSSNTGESHSSSGRPSTASAPSNHDHVQTAKKRERNRLAAEKCRLKKQGKIAELENEKRKRIHENQILLDKVQKRKETLKKLRIFYGKLKSGEFKPQPYFMN